MNKINTINLISYMLIKGQNNLKPYQIIKLKVKTIENICDTDMVFL